MGKEIGYIQGWAGVAEYLGVTPRTAKAWHYRYLKIPFVRDGAPPYSRLRIRSAELEIWYRLMREMRNELLPQAQMNTKKDSEELFSRRLKEIS